MHLLVRLHARIGGCSMSTQSFLENSWAVHTTSPAPVPPTMRDLQVNTARGVFELWITSDQIINDPFKV